MPSDAPEIGWNTAQVLKEFEPNLMVKHDPSARRVRLASLRSPSNVMRNDPHAKQAWDTIERNDRAKSVFKMRELSAHESLIGELSKDPDGIERSLEKVSKFALQVERNSTGFQSLFEKLSPTQQRYYTFIRDRFDDLGNRLGIAAEDRITNYIPHLFDRQDLIRSWQQALVQAEGKPLSAITAPMTERGKEIFTKIQEMSVSPTMRLRLDHIPESIRNGFLLERKTGLVPEDFNIAKAFHLYVERAARTIYDNPALKIVRGEVPLISDPAVREFAKEYVHDYFSPSFPSTASELSALWTETMFHLKLGFNTRSVLTNLSGNLFTNALIGPKATVSGGTMLWRSKAARELFEASGHTATIPQFYAYEPGLAKAAIRSRFGEGVERGLEKVGHLSGALFNKAEYVNRGTAYLGSIVKSLKKELNLTTADAMEMIDRGLAPLQGQPILEKILRQADDVVIRSQFRYGKVDLPAIMRKHPTARALLQFQTFGIKATEFMWNLAKEDPKKLAAFLAIQYGAIETGRRALGIDMRDALGVGIDPVAGFTALRKINKGDLDSPSISQAIAQTFPLLNGRSGVLPAIGGTRFGGPGLHAMTEGQELLGKLGTAMQEGRPFSDMGEMTLKMLSGTFSHSQATRLLHAYKSLRAARIEGKVDDAKYISAILGYPNYRWLGEREYLRLLHDGRTNQAAMFQASYEKAAQEPLRIPQTLIDDAIQYAAERRALRELRKGEQKQSFTGNAAYILNQ